MIKRHYDERGNFAADFSWTFQPRVGGRNDIKATSAKGVLNMVRSLVAILLVTIGGELFSPAINVTGPVLSQSNSITPVQARKRALLVGVSDYCRDSTRRECYSPTGKDWWNLNSAPDVEAIEQVLTSDRFGFRPDEIRVLKTKAETTHRNIVDTFKTFLIEQTQPGDIVYFHYSGHGGQVPDDDAHGPNPKVGDELDGLDESLIPSDYVARDDGSNNIRDDEIEQLLTSLSGRHVTITVDSCYSGTITRGGRSLTRGLMFRGSNVINRSGLRDSASGLFADRAKLSTDVVVISAARNDQSAGEIVDPQTQKAMGAFSYALVRALADARPETTYRDIFEEINEEVSREQFGQDPQLEGSRDNILFSGIARPPQPYINVGLDGSKVMLKAGSLQGITKGSRFSIYRGGASPKSDSISQGEVVAIGPTSSVLNLTPSPDDKMLEALRTARAFETYHNFGDVRLSVLVDENAKSMLGEKKLRELGMLELVSLAGGVNNWNVRVCRGTCPDEKPFVAKNSVTFTEGLTMMRQDGSVIERIANGPRMLDEIKQAFEGEARWRLVKSLKHEDADLRLKMRLVPVTKIVQDPNTKLATSAIDLASEVQPQDGAQIVLHDGDTVMLEVMNLGTVAPFVSVLDLRSDGQIGPLFPHPQIQVGVNENRIEIRNDRGGKPVWQRIPFPFVIKITEPYGPEVFKALITEERTDFSPLFRRTDAEDIQYGRPRGTSRGQEEAKSPLGQLLLTAVTGRTRLRKPGGARGDIFGIEDAANLGVPVEKWATAEITFEARPPRTANEPPK